MKYRFIYFCIAFLLFNCHSNKEKTVQNDKNTFTHLCQKGTYFFHISEYENQNAYDSAVYYLDKFCKLAQNQQDTSYTNALFQLARSYESIEEIEKADSCFKKATKQKTNKTNCIYTYWAGTNKYNNSSDYALALDYFQQCLDCQEAIYDYSLYMDMGNVYAELKYTPHFQDSALSYYKKAIYTAQPNIVNEVYLSIASFYNDNMTQYDSSLVYFQKIKEVNPPEFYWNNYAKLLRNVGREENNIQKYQTALTFYKRELSFYPDKSPTDKGIIYNEIGFCYLDKAKLEHSLKLEASIKQEIDSANYYFSQVNHFFEEEKSSILWTIRNYSGKGRTHLFNYQLSQNPDNLDKSADYFAKILTLMPRLRKKLETETSKSILTDLLYNAYEPALEANYALYKSNPTPENLQSAYNFIQSSKALALWEEMNRNQKNKTQNIDNQVKIADIQAKCKAENSVFVDYFQGKENVFIFYATAEKQGLIQKKCSAVAMNTLIPYYFQKMKDIALLSPELKNMYKKLSFRFYQNFWQDLDSVFHSLSMPYPVKATLVLDGYLHKIPFDALHCDSLGKEYLIDKYNFSYAFSSHFWLENSENKQVDASIVAFAPIFDTSFYQKYAHSPDNFEKQLSETQHTLDSLQNKYAMKTFLRAEATKQRFFELAPKYNIVHLATHGFADEENAANSFVALTPNSQQTAVQKGHLMLNEIYDSKMKAELALLTACETGKGQIKKGEGVMSLARAFRYAGCERVIMTLWSVNQASTMEITQKLYDNLAKGESYGDALYHAKKSYLIDNEDYRKYPILWSGMVLVGNANGSCKIPAKTFFTPLNLMLGGFVMTVIAFLIWYLQKRKLRK